MSKAGWALNPSAGMPGPDARTWAAAVADHARPGDKALVSSLARFFALAHAEPGVHVRDLDRDLAMQPDAKRITMLRHVLNERLGDTRYPGDLWLDGAFLPTWPEAPPAGEPAWRHELFELLADAPAPVESVGDELAPMLRVLLRR